MVIANSQLKRLNEMYRRIWQDKNSTDGEKNVFMATLATLGLRITKIDGVKCVVPEIVNEMYWRHARSIIHNFISDTLVRIALQKSELKEMELKIKKNDENRRRNLLNSNYYCRRTVEQEKKYLEEIEKEG